MTSLLNKNRALTGTIRHLTMSMLPFLNAKKRAQTIIEMRKASGEKGSHMGNALLAAIEAKDAEAILKLIKQIAHEADAEPHVEGKHEGEE